MSEIDQMEPPQPLRQAISDPGSFVPRQRTLGAGGDELESLVRWQARAVMAWLLDNGQVAQDTQVFANPSLIDSIGEAKRVDADEH